MDEALFYFGDTLKALDDKGRVGGYALRFTDREHRDLHGTYFTKDTYLGAHQGDGVDVLFHHGQPLRTTRRMTEQQKKALDAFKDHIFSPAKTKRDEVGLFTEVVLDMSDEYERAVYGLVKSGKLGWSSGSTWHMVKATDDGEITRWPIIEISLTPQPAEKLNKAVTLKAIESLKFIPLDDEADDDFEDTPMSEPEKLVASFKTLDIDTHSRLAVSALKDLAARFRSKYEARLKDKRALSEAYCQHVATSLEQCKAATAEMQALLNEAKGNGKTHDTERRAKETERLMAKYLYDRR
jgi:hypothetical protein